MKKFITRPELAKSLGKKTGTLAMWDRKGKGPGGRFYLNETSVVYPAEEVEKWLRQRRLVVGALPAFDARDERGRILAIAKAEAREEAGADAPLPAMTSTTPCPDDEPSGAPIGLLGGAGDRNPR